MPGPFTTFTRANSDVPGSGQGEHHFAAHPSGLCRLMVWRPTASFVNAPLLLWVKGFNFQNFGDTFSSPDGQDPDDVGWTNDVSEQLNAAGWAIAAADYPPGPFTTSGSIHFEVPGFSFFPETEALVATAISYLRTHASGEANTLRGSARGTALWGASNSIDPARVVVIGVGTGGTLALMASLTAQGELAAFGQGRRALSRGAYVPRSGTKPKATIAIASPVDWTQFHVRTGSVANNAYQLDRHPHFMRLQTTYEWSELDGAVKQAASPYHHLVRGLPENRSLAVYASWRGTTTTFNANLGPQDFEPGVPKTNEGALKAFNLPGHFFQGRAWDLAAAAHLSSLARTRWGTSLQNPTTPHFTGAALATDIVDWLTNTVEV